MNIYIYKKFIRNVQNVRSIYYKDTGCLIFLHKTMPVYRTKYIK